MLKENINLERPCHLNFFKIHLLILINFMFFFILYRDSADGRGSGYKRNGKLRIEGFRIAATLPL